MFFSDRFLHNLRRTIHDLNSRSTYENYAAASVSEAAWDSYRRSARSRDQLQALPAIVDDLAGLTNTDPKVATATAGSRLDADLILARRFPRRCTLFAPLRAFSC